MTESFPSYFPASIPDLLLKKAQEQPDKIFLHFRDEEITYRSLLQTVQRVGTGLGEGGVQQRDPVALMLRNTPDFLYAYFGVMWRGAVCVPVNTQLKPPEVGYILRHSEARVVIVSPEYLGIIEAVRGECPDLQGIVVTGEATPRGIPWSKALSASPMKHSATLQPSDSAAIIYTSGTTGKPKGVVLTHGNYIFDVHQLVETIRMIPQDRFLCILPLFHVNGQVVTILGPLYAGAGMILLEQFSPRDFLAALARYKATAFSGVPTVYAILLNLPDADEYDLSSLRFCICGGAPMPVEVFERFEQKFKAFILEGYGLSEGTCVSSVNPVGGKRKIGSIGLPLRDQEMRILNEQGKEAAPGDIGEIAIRGRNVMAGYLKDPAATAEVLKGGWLHTGDLGYWDTEGYFFIVGRKKEMIIRGGENIYPKEIEEVLYRHPKVLEAAVIGLPDQIWGEEVCAFIVLKEGMQGSPEEFIEYCKSRLADFKCPRKVVFWGQFPKTATGKIQKGKLKKEYLAKSDGGGA